MKARLPPGSDKAFDLLGKAYLAEIEKTFSARGDTFWLMTIPTRRRFLLRMAALVPLPLVARRLHATAVAALDPARLRALGDAVLPLELGVPGIERAVSAFELWLAGYREGVELLHGYGTAELRLTGPSPALRWATQLEALGSSFAGLDRAARQATVRSALEAPGTQFGTLPAVDRAPHVATGLLSFYYTSPEAVDLCYEAMIGRNRCRPLAESGRKPLPLARRG